MHICDARSGTRSQVLAVAALLSLGSSALAVPVIIDDFEGSEGHFNSANPGNASGTNRNITSATADLSVAAALSGTSSEVLTITPINPGTASDFPTTSFRLRFLSGGGTPANNVNIGPDGYVGYFLRTTTPDLLTAPALDDGAALELGALQPVIADGAWHLYQFNLDDDALWNAFAGTGPNGAIEGPTVTIDSIFIQGLTSTSGIEVYLDAVAYNTTGDLVSVPEPASLSALSLGVVGLLMRRKR